MLEFFSILTLGAALGYCFCMFRVNDLQNQVNQLKIDALHEGRKCQHIEQLRKEQK